MCLIICYFFYLKAYTIELESLVTRLEDGNAQLLKQMVYYFFYASTLV